MPSVFDGQLASQTHTHLARSESPLGLLVGKLSKVYSDIQYWPGVEATIPDALSW